MQRDDAAARRKESARDILGIHARFERMPRWPQIGLSERKMLAVGDPQLQLDEIEAPHCFGDRVLDLQAGVHLHEERLVGSAAGRDELDGAGIDVSARNCRGDGLCTNRVAVGWREKR